MGIPPEILQMMKMTEMMHDRSGPMSFFGGPKKKKPALPRHEESHDDILAKMNRLSDEIGERKNKKYEKVDSKSARLLQVMVIAGIMLIIMLASFVLTCRGNAKNKQEVEEEDENKPRARQVPARKAD
jgi:hypothetical protein